MDAFGMRFCDDLVVETAGQMQMLSCQVTGWEGIWSTAEAGSYRAVCAEHVDAHDLHDARAERHRDAYYAEMHASRVYRTTEPGHPARRGIGPYLRASGY